MKVSQRVVELENKIVKQHEAIRELKKENRTIKQLHKDIARLRDVVFETRQNNITIKDLRAQVNALKARLVAAGITDRPVNPTASPTTK